ncbi:MAG: type II secretion system F family protein [Clostridiales bacterium]|jgi:type IV pilus assembly protein PilC|nr:type II secretion system F family protein [Clostridiales bacterium]
MKEFYYKALGKGNIILSGKVLKNNKAEVLNYLKSSGLVPVVVKKSNIFNTELENLKIFKKSIKSKQLYIICKQLAFIFSSGMPASKGALFVASQSAKPYIKNAFNDINNAILRGGSFSEALERQGIFPGFFVSMVKVSEASGTMDFVMGYMSKYFQQKYIKNDRIMGALLYPIIVALLMLIVIVGMLIFVVPIYVDMFSYNEMPLPLPTRILINMSNFVVNNFIFIIIFMLAAVFSTTVLISHKKGKHYLDFCLLNLFFTKGIYLKYVCFRFSMVLSILYKSGVKVTESLEIIKDTLDNTVLDKSLNKVILEVSQGAPLSVSLAKIKYFDSLLISMLELGEETGQVSETMDNYSKYLDFELESQLVKINKLIEPAFTIVIGVVLAFVLLAMFMPSMQMTDMF